MGQEKKGGQEEYHLAREGEEDALAGAADALEERG